MFIRHFDALCDIIITKQTHANMDLFVFILARVAPSISLAVTSINYQKNI